MTLIAKIAGLTVSLVALLAGHKNTLTIALTVIGLLCAFAVAVSEGSWRQSCAYCSQHPSGALIVPVAWRHSSFWLLSLIILAVATLLFAAIGYTIVREFAGVGIAVTSFVGLLILCWLSARLLGIRKAKQEINQFDRKMAAFDAGRR
jgi:hypothetical protein